ncbi:MAG: hypothetical protein COA79_24835 [Planctomycetota bacterium]|nr:MAG: hypothetical protein COA79_24835 [Planctomycetota bacterium]
MLNELINTDIIVDTPYDYQYIGKLIRFDDEYVELETADVHDTKESSATKEQYAMEASRDFIKANRKKVLIKQSTILSISKLEDIIIF